IRVKEEYNHLRMVERRIVYFFEDLGTRSVANGQSISGNGLPDQGFLRGGFSFRHFSSNLSWKAFDENVSLPLSDFRTMKAATSLAFSISGIPFSGPRTQTTFVILSAVMPWRAMIVTLMRSVRPKPVRGSTMWE